MTCGVYLLGFTNTPKVYIGKSNNIESRYTRHLNDFTNKTHSAKMNAAYAEFGKPELELLEICLEETLEIREAYFISFWNAVEDGFNTRDSAYGGCNLPGELNGSSIYSNVQIKEVFQLLVPNNITYQEISNKTNVSIGVVSSIARGNSHKWLKLEYPESYSLLLESIGDRYYRGPVRYIYSPTGEYLPIYNVKEFALLYNIGYSGLQALLSGNSISSHSGWSIYPPKTPLIIQAPTGELHSIINIKEFCRLHNLNDSAVGKVIRKIPKYKSHKGWRLPI